MSQYNSIIKWLAKDWIIGIQYAAEARFFVSTSRGADHFERVPETFSQGIK
jgi:hypothetical protein